MFLQLTSIGLSMGMIYAFMAMGVILLVRAIGVMNFAQGDLLTIGAFFTFALGYQIKLPLPAMLAASLLIFAVGGVIFMFVVYWPLRNSSWPATVVISTLGASIIIKELLKFKWGTIPIAVPPIVKGTLKVAGAHIEYQYLIIIGVGAAVIMGVFLLFDKMYAGRAMQAAAQDKYSAELLGIPTIVTTAVTYAISMALAGIGGYLVAPLFLVSLTLGSLQLKAFAGIVIGGFGNIKGAVAGSILVGLLESFSTLVTTTYKDAIVFLVLIIVLVARPQGLFGELIDEKA